MPFSLTSCIYLIYQNPVSFNQINLVSSVNDTMFCDMCMLILSSSTSVCVYVYVGVGVGVYVWAGVYSRWE